MCSMCYLKIEEALGIPDMDQNEKAIRLAISLLNGD